MEDRQQQLDQLAEIRSLMERSSRFLSLSGLSGVSAGVFALVGAAMVYVYLGISPFSGRYLERYSAHNWGIDYNTFLVLDAGLVMFFALLSGSFFTLRKSRKEGYSLWNPAAKRLAINIFLPLSTGGIFCLILLFKYGEVGLIAPATLIFYGLTLLNASKYTHDDLRYLGIAEIILGLIATWFIGFGLLFWSLGFGVLHIVYGTLMYFKYDRKA